MQDIAERSTKMQNQVHQDGEACCYVIIGKLQRWWNKRSENCANSEGSEIGYNFIVAKNTLTWKKVLLVFVVTRRGCGENKSQNAEGSR